MIATAVKHLLAAGVTGDALVEAIADMEAAQPKDEAAERRRAKDREYQAGRRRNRQISADSPDAADEIPSLDKSPQTPKINPNPDTHGKGAHVRETSPKLWSCPDGVELAHWRDFLGNRRRKKLGTSETAYLGQLKLLGQFASDEWPPGRLIEHAAEKGWGTIVDPSEYETPRNGKRPANDHRNEPQNAMFRVGLAEFGAG